MHIPDQDRECVALVGAGVVWMQGGGACAALLPLIRRIPCWMRVPTPPSFSLRSITIFGLSALAGFYAIRIILSNRIIGPL
jgi:hypothetical protein